MRCRLFLLILMMLVGAAVLLAGCRPRGPRRPLQDRDPVFVIPAIADVAGKARPDMEKVAQLVARLDDDDPAVRWAAHEALKQLSGRDFGYRYWASPGDRLEATEQWQRWAASGAPLSPRTVLRGSR